MEKDFKKYFFKKIFGGHKSFLWGTDITVLDFWWCLLWVSKPEWVTLFALGGGIYVTCPLRFTSGVTPADLLVASMAAKALSCTYLRAGIGGAQNWDLLCHRQMLYQLSFCRLSQFCCKTSLVLLLTRRRRVISHRTDVCRLCTYTGQINWQLSSYFQKQLPFFKKKSYMLVRNN